MEAELKSIGFRPTDYLRQVRRKAREAGYDPDSVLFSDKAEKKLVLVAPDGRRVYFGATGYGDHLIYLFLESEGFVEPGTAAKKRRTFQRSHRAMRGSWRTNPYSANRLALDLLW
jgi:hypothetical protein